LSYEKRRGSNVDTRTRNVLSICSGVGGIELGLHAALDGRTRTVCYVENELSVASILAARMQDGSLDSAVVWSNLRTFDPAPWRGRIHLISGGPPCQPFSNAGAQKGSADSRNLFPEVLRIADGLGLPDLFLENVSGGTILKYYWGTIRPQLREMGYQVAEGLFTASETGAPHKRERLFILAHRDSEFGDISQRTARTEPDRGGNELADTEGIISERSIRGRNTERQSKTAIRDRGSELADTDDAGLQGWDECGDSARERAAGTSSPELGELPLFPPGPNDHAGWQWLLARWPELAPTYCKDGHDVQPEVPAIEPSLLRGPHGTPTGVDRRLRAIGNGVVPIVSATAYLELTKQLEDEFSRNA
jgi:DNA (cytosine-5)-methyltransferase 1